MSFTILLPPRANLCIRYCTNKHTHPGVLGLIPKREELGKTGRHPVLKYRVPHGSHGLVTDDDDDVFYLILKKQK
jgi:hypothetical protein